MTVLGQACNDIWTELNVKYQRNRPEVVVKRTSGCEETVDISVYSWPKMQQNDV